MSLLSITKSRKVIYVPTDIIDDPNVSMGAKGLFVMLLHKNDNICKLEDLAVFVNSTEEEIMSYFEELTNNGYITKKKNKMELQMKAVSDKSTKKATTEEAVEYAKTEQPKPKNGYEAMIEIIDSYDIPQNVKQLLIVYFDKWINRKGRFAEADKLNRNLVRTKIGELVSLHLSDDDMITCVQKSIDMEWYKFVNPNKVIGDSKPKNQFDTTNVQSGSYSDEEREEILKRLADFNSGKNEE